MAAGAKSIMVIVDTSVWIDFFAGKSQAYVKTLEELIINREDLCICGIILTELLQGIRNDAGFEKTKNLFDNLICFNYY